MVQQEHDVRSALNGLYAPPFCWFGFLAASVGPAARALWRVSFFALSRVAMFLFSTIICSVAFSSELRRTEWKEEVRTRALARVSCWTLFTPPHPPNTLTRFTIETNPYHPVAQAYGIGLRGEEDAMTRASFLEELLGAVRAAVPAGPRLLFVEDALAVRGSHDACIGAERGPHCFSSSHQCVFAARLLLHYCTDLPLHRPTTHSTTAQTPVPSHRRGWVGRTSPPAPSMTGGDGTFHEVRVPIRRLVV